MVILRGQTGGHFDFGAILEQGTYGIPLRARQEAVYFARETGETCQIKNTPGREGAERWLRYSPLRLRIP